MTNTELARHIYFYTQNCKNKKNSDLPWSESDDKEVINYIANLMEMHFEQPNNLGSKGFLSISKIKNTDNTNSPNFGC